MTVLGLAVAYWAPNRTSAATQAQSQHEKRHAAIETLVTATTEALATGQNIVSGRVALEAKAGDAPQTIQANYDRARLTLTTQTASALAAIKAGGLSGQVTDQIASYVRAVFDTLDLAAEPALPLQLGYQDSIASRVGEVARVSAYLQDWLPADNLTSQQWDLIQQGKGTDKANYPALKKDYIRLAGEVTAALTPLTECLAKDFGSGCGA